MRVLKENSIGLVIDIQQRLFPHIYDNQLFLANTKKLIEGLKILEIPIVVTEQYRKGLGLTIPEISNLFVPFESLEKISFSCYDDNEINQVLLSNGRKFIIMCGIETHVCVLQTAIDLIANNYIPVVIADCVASRKIADKQIALERLRYEGAIVTSYESILFELCRYSATEQFKAISRLVKS